MIYQDCQALPNKIYVKGGEKQSIDLNCFLTNNDQSGGPSRPPCIISDSTFQITSLEQNKIRSGSEIGLKGTSYDQYLKLIESLLTFGSDYLQK